MNKPWVRSLWLALVLSLGAVPVAHADSGAAARQAAQMTGGRVLGVQTATAGGQPVYLVRVLLADGRVKIVRIEGGGGNGQRGRGR